MNTHVRQSIVLRIEKFVQDFESLPFECSSRDDIGANDRCAANIQLNRFSNRCIDQSATQVVTTLIFVDVDNITMKDRSQIDRDLMTPCRPRQR
jgi:hypothetical protein